jgi:hypothetical protein
MRRYIVYRMIAQAGFDGINHGGGYNLYGL